MERLAPCPRVNFALMERYIGQHVLLVCKVHFPRNSEWCKSSVYIGLRRPNLSSSALIYIHEA